MKIVARVDREKFFCEITLAELNAILARDDYSPMPYDMQVGDSVDLTELIKAARWIKGLDAKHLDEVLKGVERVKRSVEKLNLLNTLTSESLSNSQLKLDDGNNDDDIPF